MNIKEVLKKNDNIHQLGIKIKKLINPMPSEKKL